MNKVFKQIKRLLQNKDFSKAKQIAENIDSRVDKYNILGIIFYHENNLDRAAEILKKALEINPINDDVLFNYSKVLFEKGNFFESWRYLTRINTKTWEVYDILGDTQLKLDNPAMALHYYKKALELSNLKEMKDKFEEIRQQFKKTEKLAIFCLPGLDSFIKNIAEILANVYELKIVSTTNNNEITNTYNWADIVWLEWANEMAIHITNKLPKANKKILCRLHSYEALSRFPEQINWQNVDRLILVADHIREILETYHEKIYQQIKEKIVIIPNGLDLDKFTFKIHQPGYDVAVVAHINHKKNPTMWLQIIKILKNIDERYTLHIAGDFQEIRYANYFKYFIKEADLGKNVKLYGFVKDINRFLEDKNYVLSTSIHEGHPYNIMEAMARGIKPIIHNFAGAKKLYPESLIFNFIDEAVEKITQASYNSIGYREYLIEKGWTLEDMQKSIKNTLDSLIINGSEKNIGRNIDRKVDEIFKYLKGEKFSNSLKFEVPNTNPGIIYRLEFLEKISKGKNVIHIGFADHKDLILNKIKKGIWLHKLLLDNAKICVGVDVNCEAVEFVKNELNIDNVYCIDILKDEIPENILRIYWDFVILGEVIEHIDNPVLFLKELKKKIGKISKKIILTAPNALKYSNFVLAQKNIEVINSDHRYWFTPYTL